MPADTLCTEAFIGEAEVDDLSREVYCILGMPVDVIDMPSVLLRIDSAATKASNLFLSTPNLNFLVNFHSDLEFRDSMLLSDLSPVDGMPLVWLGRLLGVPIKERVAGSDIFAALKGFRGPGRPLRLFLFGGNEGVAAAASAALNAEQNGVACVGSHFPGYLSVEELSNDLVIEEINSSAADFLVVCLGSMKGQLWLKRNSENLRVPIRSHLGASLNFEAGTVKRAPVFMRELGLEWLWRIKEEPYLWRRYWHDGHILLYMLYSMVLPLSLYKLITVNASDARLNIELEIKEGCNELRISGAATTKNIKDIVTAFRKTLSANKRIVIDLTNVSAIDARFLGVLLVVRKTVGSNGSEMVLTGVSCRLERIIRLNGAGFLLAPIDKSSDTNGQVGMNARSTL
jgi:N-acetylglucosaminyldiphosphoundecaprenol N-acetyl-beta-D-mannosaminyltransferase